MKKNSVVLLSASLLAGSALAGSMGPVKPDCTWVGTLSAGPVWQGNGRTQTIFLTPTIVKTYVSQSHSDSLFNGEAFLGLQRGFFQNLQAQLGLAVAGTSNAGFRGVIWDDADPIFDNFTYRYKLQHTLIAAKGKLLADMDYWFIPWVSAAIGVGINHAHGFNNKPVIFEALQTPNFISHTKAAFSYTLGAGIQKEVTDHWQVGVGYEFSDWGRSRLDRAPEQTRDNGLGLNHLYTNGVLFNITYLA